MGLNQVFSFKRFFEFFSIPCFTYNIGTRTLADKILNSISSAKKYFHLSYYYLSESIQGSLASLVAHFAIRRNSNQTELPPSLVPSSIMSFIKIIPCLIFVHFFVCQSNALLEISRLINPLSTDSR